MIRNLLLSICSLTLVFSMFSCSSDENYEELLENSDAIIAAQGRLTEVIVHDIFSPPVASRIYAYSALAAYEVAALSDDSFASLMGQLNGFEPKEFTVAEECSFPLAAIMAYYRVANALVFSEKMMMDHKEALLKRVKAAGISKKIYQNSLDLGEAVALHVLDYASKDNYHQSRSFEKYSIRNDPGTWQPTPPAYMEGIEPHWNKIRPFVLNSPDQFKSVPPTPYSTDKDSQFYKEADEVFQTVRNLTKEQSDIAFFWDCNPYKMNVKGHVMFAEKKVTPGGHWMGITGISAKTAGLDWKSTAEALALTGATLMDAFIACWDEKYRSVLIRPETYINLHIDEDWLPLLQTPPFPEYTSGHSVISTAASRTLTHLFGEPFHFVDSTEVAFGLPVREFDSFKEAAEEAAISRLYGGIHYMPAIVHGASKGAHVGEFVVSKISTKKDRLVEK